MLMINKQKCIKICSTCNLQLAIPLKVETFRVVFATVSTISRGHYSLDNAGIGSVGEIQ